MSEESDVCKHCHLPIRNAGGYFVHLHNNSGACNLSAEPMSLEELDLLNSFIEDLDTAKKTIIELEAQIQELEQELKERPKVSDTLTCPACNSYLKSGICPECKRRVV